jgi:hypothetical protein
LSAKEHLVDRTYIDKNGEEKTKKGVTYNPFLKTKLTGVLDGSFLRSASPSRSILLHSSSVCGGSLRAISRPLPGKPFPNEWDFCVEACVLQDRDRFVFGDFVVVIAAFFDGLDECFELFLRDPGAQDHRFASKIHSRIIAENADCYAFFAPRMRL